ncbi:hypothetical protein Sya03_56380 [Spirilliplanes yamanashiensis]|uniref:Uncharacterized protein n=2 Tax=Spirilliplanes yamanashiensis TaxID=42233 RepID=A0A8J3YCM5_9ACTN|nr:hypothetical protein Sya03_56380 [Spirilliplanes yamanashiensis]
MAMLLTVVALGLSMVLASVVSAEQRNTRRDTSRMTALAAAQSGLDVALSAVRLARRTDGTGDPQALPCTTAPRPALSGPVSAGGGATFSVRVYYSTTPPVAGTVPSSLWGCGPTATGMPAYALIVSTGTAGISRTMSATYTFTTVIQNEKVPGGIIRSFGNAGTPDYCFAAGSTAPLNTQLLIRPCNPADARQQFAYTAGLTLQLTKIKAGGQRLCVDAGTMALNAPVTFQLCAADLVARQVWGSDDSSAFYVMPNATTRRCMESSAEYADATVQLVAMKSASYCTQPGTWQVQQTFFTSSATGGGKAGPATGQLVNGAQFGRCIDVTADDVTSEYLISFPCKQPLTGEVLWNQRWNVPQVPAGEDHADGPIWTVPTGTTQAYCLRGPGTTARPGYYVVVTTCNPGGIVAAAHQWRVWGDTGNKTTSYRIESLAPGGPGTCLTVTDPAAPNPDLWDETWNINASKLVMGTCNGTDFQKWNASSVSTAATVRDVTER